MVQCIGPFHRSSSKRRAVIQSSLTKAMGLDIDLSGPGLGVRSKRFAAVVDNGVVTDLAVEASPPEHTVSSAESVLERL